MSEIAKCFDGKMHVGVKYFGQKMHARAKCFDGKMHVGVKYFCQKMHAGAKCFATILIFTKNMLT